MKAPLPKPTGMFTLPCFITIHHFGTVDVVKNGSGHGATLTFRQKNKTLLTFVYYGSSKGRGIGWILSPDRGYDAEGMRGHLDRAVEDMTRYASEQFPDG